MPHSKNKVEWCLRKAEKELKEGERHRGLLKVKPDQKTIRAHIKKAEHNLNAVTRFKEIGYSDWSASAAFYCIYHCLLAIARKFGYESRNQKCTFALIYNLIEEGRISLKRRLLEETSSLKPEEAHERPTITDVREAGQYGVTTSIKDETLERLVSTAKTILDETKTIIES